MTTRAQQAQFMEDIYEIVWEMHPCSSRQVYYVAVSRGIVKKDEGNSRASDARVNRALGVMRENTLRPTLGDDEYQMPFDWIEDSTRWRRGATLYRNANHALYDHFRAYRRDLWQSQPRQVEVWCESASIAGILNDTIWELGVDLMACRGQASKGFVHAACQEWTEDTRPVTVLYVGDFDPSGLNIADELYAKQQRYAPDVDLDFRRLGVNPDQIRTMGLPGHTTNRQKSGLFAQFARLCRAERIPVESVETEALPPSVLRDLVRDAVMEYVDPVAWQFEEAQEARERAGLRAIATAGIAAVL